MKNSAHNTAASVRAPNTGAPDNGITVALLHYSCPPVIGGVEFVLEAHARLLTGAGFRVRLVVGKGEARHPGVDIATVPELASDGGPHRKIVKALNAGRVPDTFPHAVAQTEQALIRALRGADVCLVHNVMTMHFNLVASAALANIMERGGTTRFVAWCHDSTFADSNYRRHQRADYPWSLLRQELPGCDYCVISRQRQKEFRRLFGVPAARLPVIPDGVSVTALLGLTPQARAFYREERLNERDVVAITPTRIVRRKNLEAGMRIVAALKNMGKSVCWIVTGAPDPHNSDSTNYYRELTDLRRELNLEREAVFLCERFPERIGRDTLRSLLSVSDLLVFPSKKEGFGIPVLEAGLADLILVLGDIPALREIAAPNAVFIPKTFDPKNIARLAWKEFRKSPTVQFRKKIQREYSWEAVFKKKIQPAILEPETLWRAEAG